ncbi:Lrp/AsnC ligand binding domain-containing protein [Arthrobacter bambusae]
MTPKSGWTACAMIMAAGSVDLLVEVIATDPDDLYEIINRRIRTIPGVRAV